jgi:signal transduction histidine kinase
MAQPGGRPVSLRRRFLLILGLAIVALGAATLAAVQLRADGASEREKAAFARGEAATEALDHQLAAGPLAAPGALAAAGPDQLAPLREFVALLVAPLVDASAGYCSSAGELLVSETAAPIAFDHDELPHHGPPGDGLRGGPPGEHSQDLAFARQHGPHLLPIDREVVQRACRSFVPGGASRVRFAAPNDVLFVSVRGTAGGLMSWALVRMPNRARDVGGHSWAAHIGLIGLLALLLVVLTADALLVLRRGSDDLQLALVRLQGDLRAAVPRPRAEELARLADGLRTMADHLAEAHDRERLLERRLGQEQRLAGLGRVVAGVAHEVRNPLTGLKLKLDTMARRKLDERSTRDVGVCLQEIARLDRVVSSLLLVARKGPIERSSVDLAALVDERLGVAEALAAARGVERRREGEARVEAHAEHLTRVIDNLVRNAIEASPAGEAVLVRIEMDGGETRLIVVDRGSGVPAEREGELFEPFFTLKSEGTGLGLFLSRVLVEAHGGRLSYHREGAETRFVVTLPPETRDA